MQSECLQWGSHGSRDAALQGFASENISMNLFFLFFALITAVTSPVNNILLNRCSSEGKKTERALRDTRVHCGNWFVIT